MHAIKVREIVQPSSISKDETIESDYYWLQDEEFPERSGLTRTLTDPNSVLPARITKISFDQGASGQGGLGLTGIFLDNGYKIISRIYGSPSKMISIIKDPKPFNGIIDAEHQIWLAPENVSELIGQTLFEHIQDPNPILGTHIFRIEKGIMIDLSENTDQDLWFAAHSDACIWDA